MSSFLPEIAPSGECAQMGALSFALRSNGLAAHCTAARPPHVTYGRVWQALLLWLRSRSNECVHSLACIPLAQLHPQQSVFGAMASDDAYLTCVDTVPDLTLDTSQLSLYDTALDISPNTSTPTKSDTAPDSHDTLATLSFTDSQLDSTDISVKEDHYLHSDSSSSCTLLQNPTNELSPDKENANSVNSLNLSTNDIKLEYIKLLTNMKQISLECPKIDILLKQLTELSVQMKVFGENLIGLSQHSVDLIDKLFEPAEGKKNMCDAQTQTDDWMSNNFNSADVEDNESDITLAGIEENLDEEDCAISKREMSDSVKYKLRKVPALVKGYLTRRLQQTEKVHQLKRTIRDTSTVLVNFKANLFHNGKLTVTHDDILFHQRLCVQLENSCKQLYAIFFATSKAKQMGMIAEHRQYMRNLTYLREKRANSALSQTSGRSQGK